MKSRLLLLVPVLVALTTLPEATAQQPRSAKNTAATAKSEKANNAGAPVKEDLKRLILKDGSYQSIVKYQLIGDRVHYLSAERDEWEDIPSSLIDWEASRKYTAEMAAGNAPHAHEVDAEEAKEGAEEEAKTPTVSPGIKLPLTGGIWMLDVYQGRPELSELIQNGADINKNMAGNILRGAINPLAGNKQTVELKGPHARVQAHVGDPFIYVAVDQDTPDPEFQKKHWRLVHAEEKKGDRIIGNVNIAIYGKAKEKANYIDAQVTAVSGPWIKVVPAEKLQPGEYALVEMLGDQGMNRFVWDFGVNPGAPQNPGAWKAAPAKAGSDATPNLTERKP